MKALLGRIARLLAFCLGLCVLLHLANIYLVQGDSLAHMTLRDMQRRDNIELAVVGSSMAQYHLDPEIITRETGRQAFTAAVTGLMPPGAIALTRELFETNSPDQVVLVLESGSLDTVKEDTQTYMKLSPLLTNPLTRLEYFRDTCSQDGLYMDRLFLFRSFGFESRQDAVKAARLRFDEEDIRQETVAAWKGTYAYHDGFLAMQKPSPVTEDTRDWFIRHETGYTYELLSFTKECLLRYKALCDTHGAALTVVISPEMTMRILSMPEVLQYVDSAQAFLDAQGIPCYNLLYAKEALLPDLNAYYYDYHHMTGEGARILSQSLSRLLLALEHGEDVSGLFYQNRHEYLASIDGITNAWMTAEPHADGSVTLRADCNRGTNVQVEYQFTLEGEDGSETLLRDYASDPTFTCRPGRHKKGRHRVRARVKGESKTVSYELLDEEDCMLSLE